MSEIEFRLVNFQTHANTAVKVQKPLTAIVGPNSVGKSAFLQAIAWILEDIKGNDFIRDFTKRAEASIKVDGLEVVRSKGPRENRYVVQGTAFDSVGFGAPPEVLQALNLSPLRLDKDYAVNLSIAEQLSPHFLIFDKNSIKAKFLGALTGLNKIDAGLRETNRSLDEAKRQHTNLAIQQRNVDVQLKAYEDLPQEEYYLRRAETALKALGSIQTTLQQLRSLREGLKQVRQRLTDTRNQLHVLKPYTLSLGHLEDQLMRIQQLYQRKQQSESLHRELQSVQDRRGQAGAECEEVHAACASTMSIYAQKLKAEKVCPICLSEVTDDVIERCINEL